MDFRRSSMNQLMKRLAAFGSMVLISACTVSSSDHSTPTPSTRYSLTNGALTVDGSGLASLKSLSLTGQPTLNLALTKSSARITARPSVSTGFKLLNNSLNMAFADTSASFTISDASNLQFSTAGTERMRIVDTTGYVGIGTAIASNRLVVGDDSNGATGAPASAIAVGSAAGPSIVTLGQSATARVTLGWAYNATPASAYARISTAGTSNPLVLQDVGGNVGIGTSSPVNLLQINNPAAAATSLRITNSNTGMTATDGLGLGIDPGGSAYLWQYENNVLYFGTNNTERMRIDAAGNVGIGTTSPTDHFAVYTNSNVGSGAMVQNASNGPNAYSYLVVMNDTNKAVSVSSNSSLSGYTTFGASSANTTSLIANATLNVGTAVASPLILGTNSLARLTILPDGKTGLGATAPATLFQVGTLGDGSVAVANAWNTFSDGRLKNIIGRIPNASGIVGQLNGYFYTWKNGKDQGRQVGVIAQEVERVLPELVKTGSDGIKTVDYPKIAAVLIEANKEQSVKIAELEKSNLQLQQIKAWICKKDEAAAVCQ
jgi:hypothetical protein